MSDDDASKVIEGTKYFLASVYSFSLKNEYTRQENEFFTSRVLDIFGSEMRFLIMRVF